eukprot:TRINITY_DN11875_c0_g2_i1.p1 TRINITY_DN11875_c0_g2~~TRINITY_DN11875_c0_g2_i1.p1  ORF type:complete len:482 (+),score=198.77 TRINITY_DN11875_c0_g2_i1:140-1585(+)
MTEQSAYPLCEGTIQQIRYIPVRLSPKERKRQRLVRAAVSASEYTDKVDVLHSATDSAKGDGQRLRIMLKELYNLLLGMHFADSRIEEGIEMCQNDDISATEEMATTIFELSRRYKIMNPEIMRTEYGKLLHLIQDSVRTDVQDQLGFATLKPIVTVASRAEELGLQDLLEEPGLALATTPVPRLEPISELNRALRKKDLLVNGLIRKYSVKARVEEAEVEVLIRSIDDANCYIRDNADTISTMLGLLEQLFDPENPAPGLALAISEGVEGARLSHNHGKQFHFVRQSLLLWRNITRSMYKLWLLMEEDFLDTDTPYSLEDTGQGANRKQQAPRLYAAMEEVLNATKQEVDVWIGSDRVHMGDHQVPNGFVFIQKYSQISSIINPILCTLRSIDKIVKDKDHLAYIRNVWASPDQLRKAILCDFFRHGFDGSGGDNDMDAGSCIDGRLTSAWHWCSEIKSKPFYPIFLLAGFGSFDGDFNA